MEEKLNAWNAERKGYNVKYESDGKVYFTPKKVDIGRIKRRGTKLTKELKELIKEGYNSFEIMDGEVVKALKTNTL